MRLFLLTLIKVYWAVIPEKKRRSCLFKETCSRYVYRHTSESGFFKGIAMLKQRHIRCRSGHKLYSGPNGFQMEFKDGSVINEEEISPRILESIYKGIQSFSVPKDNDNK